MADEIGAPSTAASSTDPLFRVAQAHEVLATLVPPGAPGMVVIVGRGNELVTDVSLYQVGRLTGDISYGLARMRFRLSELELQSVIHDHVRRPLSYLHGLELCVLNALRSHPALLFAVDVDKVGLDQLAGLMPAITTYAAMRDIWSISAAYEWTLIERSVLSGELLPKVNRELPPGYTWRLEGPIPSPRMAPPRLQWSLVRLDEAYSWEALPLFSLVTSSEGQVLRGTDSALAKMLRPLPAGGTVDAGIVMPRYQQHGRSEVEVDLWPAPAETAAAASGSDLQPVDDGDPGAKVVAIRAPHR